jgi:hypothetical protein
MSRIAFALVSGAVVALISLPASAGQSVGKNGMPIAPNGGKASIHQWGGTDDTFAVSPDGDVDAQVNKKAGPMAQSQGDADDDDPGDPDGDHEAEVLAI